MKKSANPEGCLSVPTRPVPTAVAALTVVFLDRHLQPRLDPTQHPPLAHATGDGLQEFGVRNLAKGVR